MAPVAYLSHRASLDHDTGAHPERIARITAIEAAIADHGRLPLERLEAPAADVALLGAVHPPAHIEAIRALAERGGGAIDHDTVASAGSYEAARHAAGGAAALVDVLLGERSAPTGFSVARPPGHHAEAARAMGFCLFNSVAVAARRARDAHGCPRVLVLDWDVHHGNGTNDIFHADPGVLFVSIHQWPLYPGTGPASDAGTGAGLGHTVNLPVPAGTDDEGYLALVEQVIAPLARAYRPGLLLISAGFDAHRDDPLADVALSTDGFAAMTHALRRVAGELDVPVGAVLEGGYDLDALGDSVVATLEALGADTPADANGGPSEHPLAVEARARVARYWPELSGRTSVT
ncbi:MAG: histone deacetylase family protein [Solirubrobacteraceae bacterium]